MVNLLICPFKSFMLLGFVILWTILVAIDGTVASTSSGTDIELTSDRDAFCYSPEGSPASEARCFGFLSQQVVTTLVADLQRGQFYTKSWYVYGSSEPQDDATVSVTGLDPSYLSECYTDPSTQCASVYFLTQTIHVDCDQSYYQVVQFSGKCNSYTSSSECSYRPSSVADTYIVFKPVGFSYITFLVNGQRYSPCQDGGTSPPISYYPPTYPPNYAPPTYQPNYAPPTYQPNYAPPTYQPNYAPPTYQPNYAPPTYQPNYAPPTYQPNYAPPTYQPNYAPPPTYPPSSYPPPSYKPTYPPDYYNRAGKQGSGAKTLNVDVREKEPAKDGKDGRVLRTAQ